MVSATVNLLALRNADRGVRIADFGLHASEPRLQIAQPTAEPRFRNRNPQSQSAIRNVSASEI
jgi:hypothetical protein